MKKSIYIVSTVLLFLISCKSKDPVEIIPKTEDPKGNFINGTAFNIESTEIYNAGDTLIITIKDTTGSIIKYNLFETTKTNEYILGKNSKNIVYYLKDSLSPLYSSMDTDEEMIFNILNYNNADSTLTFTFEGSLSNSKSTDIITIKMNSEKATTFTKNEIANESYIYYCYYGDFGTLNSAERVNVTMTDNILKFVFDITIKERITIYIPSDINSGTYNFNEGKEKSALIETKDYMHSVFHSSEGKIQIHHDKLNRRISIITEDTYSAVYIVDNSPKTLGKVIMNAMY